MEPYDSVLILLPNGEYYPGIYISSSDSIPEILTTYVKVGGEYFSHMAFANEVKHIDNTVSHKLIKVKRKTNSKNNKGGTR